MVSPEDYFEVKNYLLLVLDIEYSSHNRGTQYLQLNSHFLTLGEGNRKVSFSRKEIIYVT